MDTSTPKSTRELLESASNALRYAGPVTRNLVAGWIDKALSATPVETKALQEPDGIPTHPDLWNAVSHLLSHWDEHRKCFELCGTTMTELREAFAASAAPGRPCPPEEQTPEIHWRNGPIRETSAPVLPCWCPYCSQPHSPAVRATLERRPVEPECLHPVPHLTAQGYCRKCHKQVGAEKAAAVIKDVARRAADLIPDRSAGGEGPTLEINLRPENIASPLREPSPDDYWTCGVRDWPAYKAAHDEWELRVSVEPTRKQSGVP